MTDEVLKELKERISKAGDIKYNIEKLQEQKNKIKRPDYKERIKVEFYDIDDRRTEIELRLDKDLMRNVLATVGVNLEEQIRRLNIEYEKV